MGYQPQNKFEVEVKDLGVTGKLIVSADNAEEVFKRVKKKNLEIVSLQEVSPIKSPPRKL